MFSVLIWNHHPNTRLDDPIIRGSDLHTINRALDFRLDDPRDAIKILHPILGCIKISDELRSYLGSDLSRDLIHPGEKLDIIISM